MSERPGPPSQEPATRPWLSLLLAAVFGSACFAVLFFLTLGHLGPVLLVGAGVFLLAAFHYVVWGWWLGKIIRQDVAGEDAAETSEKQ